MLQISGKRSPTKTLSQKTDQQTLKNIVDPFLTWYNSRFDNCLEDIKKYPDHASLIEEYFNDDGSFEVNEQTLYNILSAELQGGSKVQSIHTYRTLPTIPQSIANVTNLHQKTYAHLIDRNFKSELLPSTDAAASSSSQNHRPSLFRHKNYQLVPPDFVDTPDLVRENMRHLRIVDQYFKTMEQPAPEIPITSLDSASTS